MGTSSQSQNAHSCTIEQQRTSRENELRVLEGVEAFCASVRGSLEEPSFEVKQKVLQLVVDRIVVEESRVVIQHVVPTGAVRLQTEQHGRKTPCWPLVAWIATNPNRW